MSVTYFYPPGCETNNEETCPQTKIDEICGEGEDDIITHDRIRAPFFKGVLPDEMIDGSLGEDGKLKYPGYTRHTRKKNNDREYLPGAGTCYNDYLDEHGNLQHTEGLRRWVRDKSTDPATRGHVTYFATPPPTFPSSCDYWRL